MLLHSMEVLEIPEDSPDSRTKSMKENTSSPDLKNKSVSTSQLAMSETTIHTISLHGLTDGSSGTLPIRFSGSMQSETTFLEGLES